MSHTNERSCPTCKGSGHIWTPVPEAMLSGSMGRATCPACRGAGLSQPLCTECDEPIVGTAPAKHSGLDYHPACLAAALDAWDGVCEAFAEEGDLGCLDCATEQGARTFDAAYDSLRDEQVVRGIA